MVVCWRPAVRPTGALVNAARNTNGKLKTRSDFIFQCAAVGGGTNKLYPSARAYPRLTNHGPSLVNLGRKARRG